MGYLSTITNELGQVLTISSVNRLGLPTLVVDENSVTTILAYDSLGRLETVTVDPGVDQAVTSIDYDSAGDVVKLTRPNGAYLQYTWDGARRLSSVQDNTAATVTYTRDAMGGITATSITNSGSSAQPSPHFLK
jgi:YD repeat-containing protein